MNTLQKHNGAWAQPWSLFDQMEQHMRSFLEPSVELSRSAHEARFRDVDSHYLVQVDLPGVGKDNIQIQSHDGYLHIHGSRQEGRQFEYFASLPRGVDVENIKAHYEHGVLTLALPKLEKSTKKINIDEGKKNELWNKLLPAKATPAKAAPSSSH